MTHLMNDVTLADKGAEPQGMYRTRPPRRFWHERQKQYNFLDKVWQSYWQPFFTELTLLFRCIFLYFSRKKCCYIITHIKSTYDVTRAVLWYSRHFLACFIITNQIKKSEPYLYFTQYQVIPYSILANNSPNRVKYELKISYNQSQTSWYTQTRKLRNDRVLKALYLPS